MPILAGVNISHYFPVISGEKFVVLTDIVNKYGKVKPNMTILMEKSLTIECKMTIRTDMNSQVHNEI